MIRLTLIALLVIGYALPARADDFRAYDIEIVYPWTRATAPGQTEATVFMKLTNTGDYADRLLRASSPMAAQVRLHPGTIGIAPGETAMLAPGGASVVLSGLSAPLAEGSTLSLTLSFERGGTVDISATVAGPEAAGPPSE